MAALPEPGVTAVPRRGPNRFRIAGFLALALIISVSASIVVRYGQETTQQTLPQAGLVADLLAWIPANGQTTGAFAVWTPPAQPTDAGDGHALREKLTIAPVPRTLGHTPAWETQFGWQAGLISSWAVAGTVEQLAVLEGTFDSRLIEQRLLDAGYTRQLEHNIPVYDYQGGVPLSGESGLDSPASARVIAVLDGRLITSSSRELVVAAIGVGLDGIGSLADTPTVSAALRTLAPLTALVAVDQASHAAGCVPGSASQRGDEETDAYVFAGYGSNGDGGARRTLVAVSFVNTDAASAHLPAYEIGWTGGFANTGGAGGNVNTFGTLSNVSQTGPLLVAELIDGRDDGWVRSGIRYAIPVCEVTMAAFPPALPATSGAELELSVDARLRALLPLADPPGSQTVVELQALSSGAGIAIPGPGATAQEIADWERRIGPLPSLSAFPLDPATFIACSTMFEIPISSLRGIGETMVTQTRSPVGVVIGTWESERLTARLVALGYDWIDFDAVRHFAYEGKDAVSVLPGPAFRNLAIEGDRMWFSDDQQLMRDMIDAVDGT